MTGRARAAAATLVVGALTFTAACDDTHPASAERGRMLLRHTRDSLPGHVGAQLQCVSCHLRDGTQPGAIPWVGVAARFPQYRSRSGGVIALEDRVNDCFQRSLNGRALPAGSRAMRDIVAYMQLLSPARPAGGAVAAQGLRPVAPRPADPARGARLYAGSCARCHGESGGGAGLAPPLWGRASYNIGAGMARLRTAAAFIRHNMPADRPGTLSDQEAYDVAAYVTSRPRPDFAGKERDWPRGDPPPDVPYRTLGVERRAVAPVDARVAAPASRARQ